MFSTKASLTGLSPSSWNKGRQSNISRKNSWIDRTSGTIYTFRNDLLDWRLIVCESMVFAPDEYHIMRKLNFHQVIVKMRFPSGSFVRQPHEWKFSPHQQASALWHEGKRLDAECWNHRWCNGQRIMLMWHFRSCFSPHLVSLYCAKWSVWSGLLGAHDRMHMKIQNSQPLNGLDGAYLDNRLNSPKARKWVRYHGKHNTLTWHRNICIATFCQTHALYRTGSTIEPLLYLIDLYHIDTVTMPQRFPSNKYPERTNEDKPIVGTPYSLDLSDSSTSVVLVTPKGYSR